MAFSSLGKDITMTDNDQLIKLAQQVVKLSKLLNQHTEYIELLSQNHRAFTAALNNALQNIEELNDDVAILTMRIDNPDMEF